MDDFSYETALQFLQECKASGKRSKSIRKVIIQLAPFIREMIASGYTQKEVYELLLERFKLELSYSAFRNYMSKKDGNAD